MIKTARPTSIKAKTTMILYLKIQTMWRVGLRNQSSAVQLQASSSVMKNRAKDNIVFQKLLEQKDCFDLKNKIKWQDVRSRFV